MGLLYVDLYGHVLRQDYVTVEYTVVLRRQRVLGVGVRTRP
jgi:hypothetical protein